MVRRNTAQTDTPGADASRAASPEPQEEAADDAVRLASIECDRSMSLSLYRLLSLTVSTSCNSMYASFWRLHYRTVTNRW